MSYVNWRMRDYLQMACEGMNISLMFSHMSQTLIFYVLLKRIDLDLI